MTSQVFFRIDTKLKERAIQRAKREGMPFSSVLKLAIKAYVEDELVIDFAPKFNAKTRRRLAYAMKETRAGRGLSPRFTNAEDAIAYLKDLPLGNGRSLQKTVRKEVKKAPTKNTR
jgi:antitoxin component of RelBE/YafQ-DinJ toxin-antitoxin module